MISIWYALTLVRIVANRVAGAERDERGDISNVLWYSLIAVGVIAVAAIFIAKMTSKAASTPTE